jgi:hypothetical protein
MAETLSIAELERACSLLERTVLKLGLATEAELAPIRPGGERNPGAGAAEWNYYQCQLHRRHALGDAGDGGLIGDPVADGEAAAMLANMGEVVALSPEANATGRPTEVTVYPKGLYALGWLHCQDKLLLLLARATEALGAHGRNSAEDVAIYARLVGETILQQRMAIWAVTSPGAGLPWGRAQRPDPNTLPAWTSFVSPEDVMVLLLTHHRVNLARYAALKRLITSETKNVPSLSIRPSWSVFIGGAAIELGVKPETLLHDWTLTEVMSAFRLSSASKRDAFEQARREAEAEAKAQT